MSHDADAGQGPTGQGPGQQQSRQAANAGRRRAAGIYGAIITASIMTAAGGKLPTLALGLSVLITLVVYWLAEQYADILGEHSAGGQLPTWPYVKDALGSSWPIVSASFVPLVVLAVACLAGASASVAATAGALAAVVLLAFHGWTAGRSAQLRGWRLVGVTSVAALLGLAMIALKNLVILHLH